MMSGFEEIGRIGRPRGLEGIVRFMPAFTISAELLNSIKIVYIKNERSDLIPVRIESVQLEEKNNRQTFFVKFDMIANRTEAEVMMDKAIFSDQLIGEDPAEFAEAEDLSGYEVIYNDELFGKVLDVLENPAHPILEIKRNKETLLVPFVDEFVDKTDHENRKIYCRNMDQLTDL
ncbi:MAG: ribosome maturation factor RimM [Balneolaceae bacterium]